MANEMKYAPVLIPTLNRYEHFKRCIESLQANEEAKYTELYIGIDYPPDEKYVAGNEKIKDYVKSISGFKKINLFVHKKNLGASENEKFLMNRAEETFDCFIFTEDDNVFSPAFLDFMNMGLQQMEHRQNIIGVCGYAYPFIDKGECMLEQGIAFPVWGYGTSFKKHHEMSDYMKGGRILFDFAEKEMSEKVKRISPYNYRLLSSACRAYPITTCQEYFRVTDLSLSAYMIMFDKKVFMPGISLVRNEGWDNSGIHCQTSDRQDDSMLAIFDYGKQEIFTAKTFRCGTPISYDKEMHECWNRYTKRSEKTSKYLSRRTKEWILERIGVQGYQKIKKRLARFRINRRLNSNV